MAVKRTNAGKRNRIMAVIVSFSMLMITLAGCGNGGTSVNDNTGNASLHMNESGQSGAQSADSTAMGRYVEEIIDLSDRIGYASHIYQMDDGNLLISDNFNAFLVSADKGETWEAETEERSWKTPLIEWDGIDSIAVGADNTVAVVYHENQGDPLDEDYNPFDAKPELMIVQPDGTETRVEVSLTEEDEAFRSVWISDTGRIFASTYGTNLYEIKEDGSGEVFLTLEMSPMLLQFQNNLMIIDGWYYEELLIYDMEKQEYIEDEVLGDFVRENYKDRSNNGGSFYDLYFFMGEENILYLAGKKGLYRHVIGGSAIEQVIDGNLSIFNNPSYTLRGMLALDNSEFVALFSGGKVVKFTYEPDIPTVPSITLKVYSLEENRTVRQAADLYQRAYPEVYVEYEIGIEEGSSVTREDALKILNTKMMADDGPDVLILDGMPVDYYMEKGLLLDLSPMLDSLGGETAFFDNLVDAFRVEDKIYMMPVEVQLPLVFGKEAYISRTAELSDIADAIEKLREDVPEKNLFGDCSASGIMRLFSMISVPFWKTEQGELDEEALEDYLIQVKRIYDAQMNGLSEEALAQYNELNDMLTEIYGYDVRESSEMVRMDMNYMDYLMGIRQMICATESGEYGYAALCSIQRMEKYEDSKVVPMGDKIFYPQTLAGIHAVSAHIEQAEAFLEVLLGVENQSSLYNGFAVNQEAFHKILQETQDDIDDDGVYSSITMMDEDEQIFRLTIYWPSEAQITELQNWIEAVKIPYIEDTVLEEAVYEAGAAYLQGTQSLEDTLAAIEKKVSIYMAE
ncbi:MAG: extracellular solute-binding protein [Lachnospiraceae bacterium]|nr:extracellular solute-binding protein [Lachnospiraceae bacterium]